jgi:hypothetical protein
LGNGQWNISIIKIGCFYPMSIIGLSSAHLRLISKTEMGSKKRPIIKISLYTFMLQRYEKYGKCDEYLRMCIFFCTFARYFCKPICNHTHGKRDTNRHRNNRGVRSAALRAYHTAKEWQVQ